MSEHAVKVKQSTKYRGKGYNGGYNQHDKALFYEQNIKVVLGTIAAGIGPKDVETLFSFLGIPVPSSFPYVTFPKIENAIGNALITVSEASQHQALKKEVKAETGQEYDEIMNQDKKIGIMGSYDMGWNKRSSGHRYDSLSGHAFLISYHCRQVIATKVTSKKCNTCAKMGEGIENFKPHQCPLNHDGSSKGMEAEAALEIVCEMNEKHDGKIYVKGIVSDDDTTMKAYLKHPDNHPKGRLPKHLPEPRFLADPGHRTKTVANKIYALLKLKKSETICTKGDCIRFKMNFGYMLKRNRTKPLHEFRKASFAVIYHSFDKHDYCSTEWCICLIEIKQQ